MLNSGPPLEDFQRQLDHTRLLSLINSMSEAFIAIDEFGKIELNNGIALYLLDTNSLLSKPVDEAMPLYDVQGNFVPLMSLLNTELSSRVSQDYTIRYTDGSAININLSISAVRGSYGGQSQAGYVVIFSDITKEKTIQEERDEFISVVSHELRNPVAVAEGSLSNAILLSERGQVSEPVRQTLKSAHEQVVFLANLINDLATISRADRIKLEETAEQLDLNTIIDSLKADYADQVQKKGLSLTVEVTEIPQIYGSRLYVREILQNFITNAIKYTEKGNITISAQADNDGVHITVADSGIGIDMESQRKLFSKFYRAQDSRVQKIGGTGLGLYVSKKLARLMGGSISMESKLNEGSKFTINLPYSINSLPSKPVA